MKGLAHSPKSRRSREHFQGACARKNLYKFRARYFIGFQSGIAEQSCTYSFPMIAAYKSMYQFDTNHTSG
jgi:hypothetical protein